MRFLRRRSWLLLGVGIVTTMAVAIPGTARATTLNGEWAPFTRCPVAASSMLAADGTDIYDGCVDSASSSGSMTLGSSTVPLGTSDLQDGVLVNPSESGSSGLEWTTVDPSGGAIVAAPVSVPGGLLGLMCPADIILITPLCEEITDSTLNAVTASIVQVAPTEGFYLGAALGAKHSIITIPVEIQLSNPILGSDCSIGSASDPIDLTITNTVAPPDYSLTYFDPDGTADPTNGVLASQVLSGAGQEDASFSVPGASGCGPLGIADPLLDLKEGIPGTGSLTLSNVVISSVFYADPSNYTPDEGQDFAAAYESGES
jgi:hypothetical protein